MSEIIPEIVGQHAEEAAFLWILRDAAVRAPHYTLKDLAKLDGRVEAHLDGLRIAGPAGWAAVKEEFKWKEAGEIFTGGVLALESGDRARIDEVVEIASSDPELARGMESALGWIPFEAAAGHLQRLVASSAPATQMIGIGGFCAHRKDPGPSLVRSCASENADLRAYGFRAAGKLGRIDLLPALLAGLDDAAPECRFTAAWSSALLGRDPQALVRLKTFDALPPRRREEAARTAFRRMDPGPANVWRLELSSRPETLRLAVMGAGAVGDPEAVPWLIARMSLPPLARAAGEALAMITGVDLAYLDLEKDKPEGFDAGPTETPADGQVALDPDEDLPWPDPALVEEWWAENRPRFRKGVRHLAGAPMTTESLRDVLRSGLQRQRAAAALELALKKSDRPLFEVRTPGFRQARMDFETHLTRRSTRWKRR